MRPQLDGMGQPGMIMKPWHLHIHGRNISFGDQVHVVTSKDRTVRLTTWDHAEGNGVINIGDYALLCPGVRIDAATRVTVGANTMLAAGVYITDADWHDIYDRSQPIGQTREVVLENNVWVGDGGIVCKGVTVGQNTVIGAGSVVTKSLPANVIAAGNPATVIRQLDEDRKLLTRQDLLNRSGFAQDMNMLERAMRADNTWLKWLRTNLNPRSDD